jgi:predicted nucleic acid-binding protein
VSAVFVDAKVFLRFFTQDDQGHHARATMLLRRAAAGEIALVAGPPVLFEIAWVLRTADGPRAPRAGERVNGTKVETFTGSASQSALSRITASRAVRRRPSASSTPE